MAKRIVLLSVLFAAAAAAVFAGALEDRGYAVLRRYEERGISYQVARDAQKRAVTVGADRELTARQVDTLSGLVEAFYALQLLTIEDLKIVFEADRAKIIVLPKSFAVDGVNLLPYMPSGLQMFYSDHLEYDFRLRADNLFLRVTGQFMNERDFAARLVRIVRNPVEYVRSQDPEYVVLQVELMRRRIDQAVEQAARENAGNLERIRGLAGELAGLREEKQALQADHEALAADYARAVADLQARDAALAGEDGRMRYAQVALGNHGLFSAVKAPGEEALECLIRLKTGNPALTRDEAVKQVRASGLKMTKKEARLAFGVYFGEFD